MELDVWPRTVAISLRKKNISMSTVRCSCISKLTNMNVRAKNSTKQTLSTINYLYQSYVTSVINEINYSEKLLND